MTKRLLVSAKFKGTEVQAWDLGARVMIGPRPSMPLTEGEPFWKQLIELQEITGWKHVYGSLAGDLLGDRECAHAFVAVNLKAMARGCSGRGWGHIYTPQTALEGLHLLIYGGRG